MHVSRTRNALRRRLAILPVQISPAPDSNETPRRLIFAVDFTSGGTPSA